MRSEKEIFNLILGYAENDPRIRAVGMEGSRTNPNVPRDIFQDYDISYLVTDMGSFMKDEAWINLFGELLIMQKPEATSLFPPELNNWFSYLMLFTDGNRIDLTLIPVEDAEKYLASDKLIKILLDKDAIFPLSPVPSDEDYHVKKPSEAFYHDCCNEFWWVSTYVGKGLWRKEILYAIDHLNNYVRFELLRMLSWKAGIRTDFSLSIGKNNKYLQQYLDENEWKKLLSTYQMNTYENCWNSLFTITGLFHETALFVGEKLGYKYNIPEYEKVNDYLMRVRNNRFP